MIRPERRFGELFLLGTGLLVGGLPAGICHQGPGREWPGGPAFEAVVASGSRVKVPPASLTTALLAVGAPFKLYIFLKLLIVPLFSMTEACVTDVAAGDMFMPRYCHPMVTFATRCFAFLGTFWNDVLVGSVFEFVTCVHAPCFLRSE